MPPWLDYATQVSELEKIARLDARPAPERRATPELAAQSDKARCLVCGKRPARPCKVCRSVSYCSRPHQRSDARWHDAVCEVLRDITEDERAATSEGDDDLVRELLVRRTSRPDVRDLGGWDDYLGAEPALPPARRRRLTGLATRPLTLASLLIALDAPSRTTGGRLRVHVMAASHRELSVPASLWAEAVRLVPGVVGLEVTLVGPELAGSPAPSDHPSLSIDTRRALYGRELWSELGRPDVVVGYDCGLLVYPSWEPTLYDLRGSGVPFALTSYRAWEAAAEARVLSGLGVERIFGPEPNRWASLAGKRSSTIANDVSFDDAFVSAWR